MMTVVKSQPLRVGPSDDPTVKKNTTKEKPDRIILQSKELFFF